MNITINYTPNDKQGLFHKSNSDEVVYGGAKGGGKSCALVMECLAYGLEHPGAEMYIFRETYDDLDANIIREWKEKVPKEIYTYHESKHVATLLNGTTVKFRYIRSYADAEGYQGRSMDWVGVDELTKHEKRSIQVLLSCLRSPKGFPPRFRGTCNPGGIGHAWVKEDFIDATNYGKKIVNDKVTGNTIEFIPARVTDNYVLMQNDPNYVKRLENLPEKEKKAFLYGDWDIFEGMYFSEFDRNIHVIEPFPIPENWTRYRSLDYGLDKLAVLWYAVSPSNHVYVYKELHEGDLIVSEAAKRIKEVNGTDRIRCTYNPSDLESRSKDTGTRVTELFRQNGVSLTQASNKRVQGWLAVKEAIKVYEERDIETGDLYKTSNLKVFDNCKTLISYIKQVSRSEKDPNDVATEPHELTHICDALRYYCVTRYNTYEEPKEELRKTDYDRYVDEITDWS